MTTAFVKFICEPLRPSRQGRLTSRSIARGYNVSAAMISRPTMTRDQFFATAIPVFLAAIFAFATAFFMDWLKTRRENHKVARERQEKELTQLNGVATAMVYNIEALLHLVVQQILPHHERSHAALVALRAAGNDVAKLRGFVESMHSEFTAMMMRCAEPYFIDLEFFKDVPFVLAKDPELLKRSGWIVSYARALKAQLNERNDQLDIAASTNAAEGLNYQTLEEQIRAQTHIGDVEVINSLLLFEQFVVISKKLKKVSESYPKELGVHLTVGFPPPLADTMRQLRRIAETVTTEFPPPDPESSLSND